MLTGYGGGLWQRNTLKHDEEEEEEDRLPGLPAGLPNPRSPYADTESALIKACLLNQQSHSLTHRERKLDIKRIEMPPPLPHKQKKRAELQDNNTS